MSVEGFVYHEVLIEFFTMRIFKNCIQCNYCGDVIESAHRHDFVIYSCGRVSVYGGKGLFEKEVTQIQRMILRNCQNMIKNEMKKGEQAL